MKRQDDIWISSILIPCDIWQTNKQHESNLHLQVTSISVAFKLSICWTKASGGDNLMRTKTRSSRMNVATDQTIILGLQIFLDHRSLSSINQKILMTSPPNLPSPSSFDLSWSFEVVWMSSESYSSSFVLLSFCVFVSISMLHLNKVLIVGVHVTNICCISKCATL